MTSADAQAFKRACSCFGLGRYFYEFQGSWVDLDQNQQPKRTPALPAWQFRKTGEKEFGPGKTATAMASTQMAQMAAVIALRSRMEHKLVQALIRARMIWITEFSLWKEPLGQPSIAVSCASTVTSNSRISSGMSQQSGGCWRSSNQPHLVSTRLSAARKRVDPKTLEILLAKL